jgi:uncharacterized protein (TIGR03086 family)
VDHTQWDAATPCDSWSVADLVAQVASIVKNLPALARGEVTPPPIDPRDLRAGARAADHIRAGLDTGVRAWSVHLSELRTFPWGVTPAVRAVQFTIVELTGHGWDLAMATSASAVYGDDDLEAAVDIARRHMGAFRRPTVFGLPLPPPPGASAFDTLAAFLGRQLSIPLGL